MIILSNNLSYIVHHPDENGITIFVSGFLFALSAYHLLLYYQHKDKAYLLYSLYTLLIFLYIYHRSSDFFLEEFTRHFNPVWQSLSIPLQWLFNLVYFVFIKEFIDLHKQKPFVNKLFNFIIYTYLIVLILLLLYTSNGDKSIMKDAYAYFFLPTITLVALYTMYVLFTMDTVLKYYVLIGSFVYLSLSLYSFYLSFSGVYLTIVFYIAIFIENMFFALGLGAKQRKILTDKNQAQEEIIKEQKIFLLLKKQIKTKLDKEVKEKTKEIIKLTQQHKEEQKEKLAIEFSRKTLDLQMKALQTQMNPHFLFNSLNSLKHYIINNKKEDAALFLSKLSKLLRNILDNSQLREISLYEELEVIKLYMEVENMRLEKNISFTIDIENDIDLNRYKLPPLILQPVIENAIWHGLSLIKGMKKIKIKVVKETTHIIIIIEDNGIGRIRSAQLNDAKFIEKESIGIEITKERLQSYTTYLKEKLTIVFEDLYDNATPVGTKVFIKIPLE